MKTPFASGLLAAVSLLACDPSIEVIDSTGGGSPTTISNGGGSGSSNGGAGGDGGSSNGGAGGGSGGDPGPCVEEDKGVEAGSTSPFPAKCGCKQEALVVLPMLAAAAKAAHDSAGSGCDSAFPVPGAVLQGKYYVPAPFPGADFNAGDPSHGWLCLGFSMPSPIHCQYGYSKGGSPVGAGVGGPVVTGAESFEVAAVGDSNGDTLQSSFTIVAQVQPDGSLVLSPLFQHQPDE